MKQIEILYFDSCPGWRMTLERVQGVVKEDGLGDAVSIKTVAVETEEQAQHARFIGSPTVRIDGRDIDPTSEDNTNFGLQCRVYRHGGRFDRVPSIELIRTCLSTNGTPR